MPDPLPPLPPEFAEAIEAYLEEAVRMQREKVFRRARTHIPHLTADDVLNPHDFPVLMRDHDFQFEDGVLAGLIQAQIGIRANFARARRGGD